MRTFLAAALLFTSLLSCPGEFTLCQQKFSDVSRVQNSQLILPISMNEELIFSETLLSSAYKKADPFLGLYLRSSTEPQRYPFVMTEQKSKSMAAVNARIVLPGRLSRDQVGLNTLAQCDQPISSPAILSDSCCNLEGVVTPQGIITKGYLRHFLYRDEVRYADAGIRIFQEGERVVVESIDPFFPDNPFHAGDLILASKERDVHSAAEVMVSILFAVPGEVYAFEVERAGKTVQLDGLLGERNGGGLLSDTYLESQGLFFEHNLMLKSLSKEGEQLGLRQGDRLIRVNNLAVSTWQDVRQHIGTQAQKATLLFERDGFHFFISLSYSNVNEN